MATKPSSVPVWNTGGDNNTEPSSGKKVTGWTVGEQPPSDYFNWLQKLYGEWLQYLSDGAFTGTATFASGLSALANQHMTVSGTGQFKHGDMVLPVSPHTATGLVNFTFGGAQYINSTGNGGGYWCPPFVSGQRVKSVTVAVYGDGSADGTLEVFVQDLTNGTATSINPGGTATTLTNPAASWADTVINVTDTTLTDTTAIIMVFSANATGLRYGGPRFTYDRP